MNNEIKFVFNDNLPHQIKAIDSVVNLFKSLNIRSKGIYKGSRTLLTDDFSSNPQIQFGQRVLENLQKIQLENDIFPDKQLVNNEFAIEMETGTGKTYVYLRTILQLYQNYGFKKFLIIVPSVAIKKGVKKSVEMLNETFKTLFNINLQKHCFVYDSKNMNNVFNVLVESKELSICIINTQSFASDNTKIKTELENGVNLWESLKGINPIVIIDEPQRVEGTKRKPSKSRKAIEDLKPLFMLKYSATFRKEFPVHFLYKLDSYKAFKDNLVKSIEVKTVYGVIPKNYPYIRYVKFNNKNLKAKIEVFTQAQGDRIKFKTFEVEQNQSLKELSNLAQYENFYIAEQPHKEKPLKISCPQGIIEIEQTKHNYEGVNQNNAVRIQIRLAIENHLKKQFEMLDKGQYIKVLSLFFVDKVIKIRDYSKADLRGEYLKIFDEEYKDAITKYESQFQKYVNLFSDYKNIDSVRQGYFAVDKNNKAIEIEDIEEYKEYKKDIQEKIDKQIDEILNGKDKLISFNSPLAFIFSQSALREGWDNPNIFTLCTLKNSSNEIAKKQEIGRGLRLPVDINGQRIQDIKINELTVIANDNYENFAQTLQKDFNDSFSFNKEEVTFDVLTKTLKLAGVPQEKITKELVDEFRQELYIRSVINDKNIIQNDGANIKFVDFNNEVLKEHCIKIKESFITVMKEKGSTKVEIKNGDEEPIVNKQQDYVKEEDFKRILEKLKQYMVKRSLYKFTLNKDEFIKNCSDIINEYLENIKDTNRVIITTGKVITESTGTLVEKQVSEERDFYNEDKDKKTDLEIIDSIMYHTKMPRLAIYKIIKGIKHRYLLNHQDILDEVTDKIQKYLDFQKAKNVGAYEVIAGYELDWGKIIETDFVDDDAFAKVKQVFQTSLSKRKALNKYYKMDSAGEYDFAQKLENSPSVVLFTKLKKGGFIIDTPYGNYSPDWAIVVKQETTQDHKMYFIIESKFGKEDVNLTDVEKDKIRLGNLHFRAVAGNDIKFDWIKDYNDYKYKFGIMEVN